VATKPELIEALSKPAAVLGLVLITILTVPGLSSSVAGSLAIGLACIWLFYVAELAIDLGDSRRMRRRLVSPQTFVDVAAVLVPLAGPLLGLALPASGLLCSIWVLKLLVASSAVQLIARVLANEGQNLLGVLSLFLLVLFCAAVLAYAFEGSAQPDSFGSVPRAMWWAIATLTTTGYGDSIPQTVAGRLLAGLVMTCGIGVFALWAGILATGFSEELRRRDFVRNWQLVTKVPVFSHLNSADLIEITRALRPRNVSAGSLICRKGDVADQMYFILDGAVSVGLVPPIPLKEGQFFGEMALITGEPRSVSVTATSDVSLLSLHASDFQILMARSPEVAAAIHQVADERKSGFKPVPPEVE
jgi:voltage-gated potassium channel